MLLMRLNEDNGTEGSRKSREVRITVNIAGSRKEAEMMKKREGKVASCKGSDKEEVPRNKFSAYGTEEGRSLCSSALCSRFTRKLVWSHLTKMVKMMRFLPRNERYTERAGRKRAWEGGARVKRSYLDLA